MPHSYENSRRLGDRAERDGVPEPFESFDQRPPKAIRVLLVEGIDTELDIVLLALEQVKGDHQNGVSHRHGGPFTSASSGESVEQRG